MSQSNLFLFHFAGGSSFSFSFLAPYLDAQETRSIELPGRGKRGKEPIIRDVKSAVKDVVSQICDEIVPGESVLYGHSLGALLVFFVAHELEKLQLPPKKIVVTGDAGPGLKNKIPIFDFDREAFKLELRKMGGIPDGFFHDERLYLFYEPILRADIKLAYDFSMLDGVQLSTPIHAIMGTDEEDAMHIENWKNYTSGSFESALLPGGHFFILNHPEQLVQAIRS